MNDKSFEHAEAAGITPTASLYDGIPPGSPQYPPGDSSLIYLSVSSLKYGPVPISHAVTFLR